MPLSSSGQKLTICCIRAETADARTFELAVPPDQDMTYKGRAGQFLRIAIPGSSQTLSRSYSLSSSPELGEPLQFTVKRVAGGAVSEKFLTQINVGQTLLVDPPAGTFTLRDTEVPLLFVAGGSGVTPVFSLLKAALHSTKRDVAFLYANRNWESSIFRQAIDRLARDFPSRLTMRHHLSDGEGFLTEQDIRTFLTSSYSGGEVYVCGPAPLMDLVEQTFGHADISGAYDLICERFLSPVVSSPDVPSDTEVTAPVQSDIIARIDGVDHSFSWAGSGTVLDAGLSANVPIPFSCREGHCGACKAKLVEGEVTQKGAIALSKRDRDRNNVLACCSTPQTPNVVLEYL